MKCSMRGLALIFLAVAVVGCLGGCSSGTKPAGTGPAKTPKETHKDDHGKKDDGRTAVTRARQAFSIQAVPSALPIHLM